MQRRSVWVFAAVAALAVVTAFLAGRISREKDVERLTAEAGKAQAIVALARGEDPYPVTQGGPGYKPEQRAELDELLAETKPSAAR